MLTASITYNKNADLRKVGENIKRDIKIAQREAISDYCEELMIRTPVNTGRAAMGWSAGLELTGRNIPNLDSDNIDPIAMELGRSESKVIETGNSISVENSVPYIVDLEMGTSRKAPAGFIRASMAAAKKKTGKTLLPIIKKAFKDAKWGTK